MIAPESLLTKMKNFSDLGKIYFPRKLVIKRELDCFVFGFRIGNLKLNEQN